MGVFLGQATAIFIFQLIAAIPVYFIFRKRVPRIVLCFTLFFVAISLGAYLGKLLLFDSLIRDYVEYAERLPREKGMVDLEREIISAAMTHWVNNSSEIKMTLYAEGAKRAMPGAIIIGLLAFFRLGRYARARNGRSEAR
jgi:hypothetical protein